VSVSRSPPHRAATPAWNSAIDTSSTVVDGAEVAVAGVVGAAAEVSGVVAGFVATLTSSGALVTCDDPLVAVVASLPVPHAVKAHATSVAIAADVLVLEVVITMRSYSRCRCRSDGQPDPTRGKLQARNTGERVAELQPVGWQHGRSVFDGLDTTAPGRSRHHAHQGLGSGRDRKSGRGR
jgi:hypothetical protein